MSCRPKKKPYPATTQALARVEVSARHVLDTLATMSKAQRRAYFRVLRFVIEEEIEKVGGKPGRFGLFEPHSCVWPADQTIDAPSAGRLPECRQ